MDTQHLEEEFQVAVMEVQRKIIYDRPSYKRFTAPLLALLPHLHN